jgi:tagatose-1,6-bisphosphate aldolase non-catalytic subunit AgaZ/GatZ
MNKFKLGFGPMSLEITEILSRYTRDNQYPLMLIASRNQVDSDTGYVCTTAELAELVAPYQNANLLVCRDHCGPGFSDLDQGLSLEQQIARCKNTITADIAAGFDLIHIDVSRVAGDALAVGAELIDFALSIKPDIMLEFGSEDNTGVDVNSSISRVAAQLEFLQQYRNNVKFFVSQTGSLTKDQQLGEFDVERNQALSAEIHAAGFLFKEHNADYFTEADINQRIAAGVDSLNIAPQLGKLQTDLLEQFAPAELWQRFSDVVYAANRWQRWTNGSTDQALAVSVSGHYCFSTPEYAAIVAAIDAAEFRRQLEQRITELVKFYKTFDHTNPDVQFEQQLKKRLAELRRRDPFIYR